MSARGLRSRFGDALQRAGLLDAADGVLRALALSAAWPSNRGFRREHPDFALPPAALAFETLGHVSAREYRDTGERHARIFAPLIREACANPVPEVLEWGCGTARILRHLRAAGLAQARLAGVDVDARSIDWCRRHVGGIEFARCGPSPPLPFADKSFDAVYHYSVLTHLAREGGEAWLDDIARVLRDEGIVVGTTHGERYADMLFAQELQAFRAGEIVTRRWAQEGRKRFLSFHPASAVHEMLASRFRDVRRIDAPDIPQDLWLARAPRR